MAPGLLVNARRRPPPHFCCEHSCAGIGVLVEHGAHVNARDNVGRTALHYACCLAEYGADVASYLVTLGTYPRCCVAVLCLQARGLTHSDACPGATLDAADTNGNTPLHLAASRGATALVALLLQRGARPTAANGQGATALHFAAVQGCAQTLACLLRGGADPSARATDGDTPMDNAMKAHAQDCVAHLQQWASAGRVVGDDASRGSQSTAGSDLLHPTQAVTEDVASPLTPLTDVRVRTARACACSQGISAVC